MKTELLADADQRIAFWTAVLMEKPSEKTTAKVMLTYWLKRRADLDP